MRREIRDFYDLKRQRVRRQRSERDGKPISEMNNNQVRFSGEILKFAGISANVSTIFASKGQGGNFNARSHALLAGHSLSRWD